MITKETAGKIWHAHDEIEKSEKLFADMKKQLEEKGTLDALEESGNRHGITLGIPYSPSGHKIYNLPAETAVMAIEKHIENKQQELAQLKAIAIIELKG